LAGASVVFGTSLVAAEGAGSCTAVSAGARSSDPAIWVEAGGRGGLRPVDVWVISRWGI
jgi:hypothetical protein